MKNKIFHYTIAHLVGFSIICLGWAYIVFVGGYDGYNKQAFLEISWRGLFIILVGAYFPEIYVRILGWMGKID